ncbi:MAG: TauD/TfdA family dioxygenase [Pseudomonadota bacterium]
MNAALHDLDVRRLTGSLGAEVRGIALSSITEEQAKHIKSLLLDHQVLFFRDQHLSQDEHVAFGSHFGELESHPHLGMSGGRPEIFELHAVGGEGAVADEWHSDLTCMEHPSSFSILQAVKCPSFGGDTMWNNAYKAYEALSEPMKTLCDGLTALHDASPHGRPQDMAIHPVVRVHPETGRKSLFVNEHFTRRIVELRHDESAMLLPYLTRWITQPQFGVRYHWSEGTVAFWDNRCTQHCVLNDFEGERIIQRVTIMGDTPQAATPSDWQPSIKTLSAASHRDWQLQNFLKAQDDKASDAH